MARWINASLFFLILRAAGASSTSKAPLIGFKPPDFDKLLANPDIPYFCKHVTRQHLERAWETACEEHSRAVKQAQDNYPVPPTRAVSEIPPLQTLAVDCPGALPDWADELPRAVNVADLFSKKECQSVIQMAEDHFQGREWTTQTSGQYQIAATWMKDVPALREWLIKACQERLFPLLQAQYPSDSSLCVDNAYLFKYTPETGGRSDIHTDSGCLSFTILLNDDFEGGGTWIAGLEGKDDNILEMTAGQVTIRPGGLKHAGHALRMGTRYIIGGFCMRSDQVEPVRQLLNAQKHLEEALVMNPYCDAVYNLLAHQYEAQGHTEKAQEVLEYCLEKVHPSSGEVAYALGSLYMKQDLYEMAAACMKVCLTTDDGDVDALIASAIVASKLGNHKQEKEYYQRVVALPHAATNAKATAFSNLGVLSEGTDQEIHFYQQSLRVKPDQYETLYSLASAHASRKSYGKAIEAYRKAVSHAPSGDQNALMNLYKVTALYVRTLPTPASPQDMKDKFAELMGKENFEQLAALQSR